jgi:glycosyltransferase involved in cell wall biosynthesis
MTRVLLVHQPIDGGVGRHVADLANGLAGLGYEVTTCGPEPPHGVLGAARHVRLDLRRPVSSTDLGMAARLARIVGHLRPHLVHAHSSKAGAVTRLARLGHPRIPVLYTPHGFAFAGHFDNAAERLAYREAERALGRLTTRVICVCEAEARLARVVVPEARVSVVHNGITVRAGGPPDPRVQDLMHRGPVVCTLGLLRPGKGVETLVDAVPAVLAHHPDVQIAVWGDGPEREALIRRARRLGVDRAVHFLGPTAAPLSAMRGAAVFVMPSWKESFPYVILEAMSSGVPIVSTDVGGVREAITDGEHGLLVPHQNAAALARAIVLMLGDSELCARLSAFAHRRVKEEFTRRRMLTDLSQLYTEILGFERF